MKKNLEPMPGLDRSPRTPPVDERDAGCATADGMTAGSARPVADADTDSDVGGDRAAASPAGAGSATAGKAGAAARRELLQSWRGAAQPAPERPAAAARR